MAVNRFFQPQRLYYLKKYAFDCFRTNLEKKLFADGRIFIVILKDDKVASVRNESVDNLTIPWALNSDQSPTASARVLFSHTTGSSAEVTDFIFPNLGIAPPDIVVGVCLDNAASANTQSHIDWCSRDDLATLEWGFKCS